MKQSVKKHQILSDAFFSLSSSTGERISRNYSRTESVNRRDMARQGMEFRLQAAGPGPTPRPGEFSTCRTMLPPCRLKPELHTPMRMATPGQNSWAFSPIKVHKGGRVRSFRLRFTRMALSALGLVAAFGLAGCGKEEAKKLPEQPAPKVVDGDKVVFLTNAPQLSSIVIETASARTLAITHLTGRLYWNDDSTVRIFTPVAGRVKDIKADLGQPVAVGAPLAEIDSPDFGQARADARAADGNLAVAEKAYTRNKLMQEHGAAAEKDVESAEAAFVAARAERERATARLANYGGSASETNAVYILRSPLAGVLVDKNINPGQELRADMMLANATQLYTPLFVVSDPTKLWLQLDVAESDLPLLRTGEKLRIVSRAFPDKTFDGVIEKIGETLDSNTRTIKVRGVVANPDQLLKAEMYVAVDVLQDVGTAAQAGVEISSKALFMKGDDSFLFIEQSPGEFKRQQVKVGSERDSKVPIFEGVTPGQKVVTEGALLLQAIVDPAS